MCSIGNSTQCSMVTKTGDIDIYIYAELIHFAIQQKLTQHYKTTMLQKKKPKPKNETKTTKKKKKEYQN